MNASDEGTPQKGSRLFWEMDNWSVAVPKEGEAQDQNPDDDTADGADAIAAARYALMSHWRVPKLPDDVQVIEGDRARQFDAKHRKFIEPKHVADPLLNPSARSRPRRARAPPKTAPLVTPTRVLVATVLSVAPFLLPVVLINRLDGRLACVAGASTVV